MCEAVAIGCHANYRICESLAAGVSRKPRRSFDVRSSSPRMSLAATDMHMYDHCSYAKIFDFL